MKSLKITLLLAVVCVALMGVTHTKKDNDKIVDEIEAYDVNDPQNQVVTGGKSKVRIPPNS